MTGSESFPEIQAIVIAVLEDLRGGPSWFARQSLPPKPISPSDGLVVDLKITSDDLSFVFVPEVQRQLGVKIPAEEWNAVYTVADAIHLLARYRAGS